MLSVRKMSPLRFKKHLLYISTTSLWQNHETKTPMLNAYLSSNVGSVSEISCRRTPFEDKPFCSNFKRSETETAILGSPVNRILVNKRPFRRTLCLNSEGNETLLRKTSFNDISFCSSPERAELVSKSIREGEENLSERVVFCSLSRDFVTKSQSGSSILNACRNLNSFKSAPFRIIPSYRTFCSKSEKVKMQESLLQFTREGNYDENASSKIVVCSGCGVQMQENNPKLPGFFITPCKKEEGYRMKLDRSVAVEEVEISSSFKKGELNELVEEDDESEVEGSIGNDSPVPVVCARCHSLRHYGKVKDANVENLLPDFDFDHTIGRKLVNTSGTRSTVLMVVDASDFIGSFPRKVARLISNTIEESSKAWKEGKSGNVPRVVLVVTKIDLLPPSISPTGLEYWVRQRAREGGANKLTSVHLVSSVKTWGIKNLVDDIQKLAGARGNVWAIGAQNAGKSTLINSIGKCVTGKVIQITEAAVPGTTLGIIRVEGVLPGKAKLFDTPGLLNPHQITTRLTREEQQLVNISKELKPRTYRIKAGYTVHIAGLMRLDVEKTPTDSIYLTVWASPSLPLHMGKTEKASTMQLDFFGRQLQPPIGVKRVTELGAWVKSEFHVIGNSWDTNSVDIAAAGLGWFAVGLRGEAVLSAWTYEGVEVTMQNSLIPNRSRFFEDAGFTVSRIVSNADRSLNKQLKDKKKKKQDDLWDEIVTGMPVAASNIDTLPMSDIEDVVLLDTLPTKASDSRSSCGILLLSGE